MIKKFLILLFLATTVKAQTISPVINEFGKKASGEFTVTNNGLQPLAVAVRAFSFTVVDGKSIFRPLDAGVTVSINTTSTRLGPKQSFTFDYDVRCASLPCAITIDVSLTGLHTITGLAVALHLPEVIYLCDKAKGCRDRIRKAREVK